MFELSGIIKLNHHHLFSSHLTHCKIMYRGQLYKTRMYNLHHNFEQTSTSKKNPPPAIFLHFHPGV